MSLSLLGTVVISTLSILHIGNTAASIVRDLSVPGSYRRYVAATIQWALAGPALALGPAGLFFYGFSVWVPINFGCALLMTYLLFISDDDNWWRRTRKRLRRWARNALTTRAPQPVGAPA